MPISDVVWDLEPHTKAKHEILRSYLGAWFPILGSAHPRILYVDGFAGPGEYRGGEYGSPIIAINVAKDHLLASKFTRELSFLFIEKDIKRANHLQSLIDSMNLPNNFNITVEHGNFDTSINSYLDDITENGKNISPSFFFIDPFGPDGFPFSLIDKIASQPRSEVLINFSYQPLNQWCLQDENKHQVVDSLFGSNIWRRALDINDPKEKESFLRQTYQETLQKLGWQVRPFKMVNIYDQTQYYLFFATKNPLGMLVMKRAMWKAAPGGEFSFHDLSNPNQSRLLDKEFDDIFANQLASSIFQKYKGKRILKQKIVNDDLAWNPICIDRHLTKALRILENKEPPLISHVIGRTRKGTYPDGCEIMFSQEILNIQ